MLIRESIDTRDSRSRRARDSISRPLSIDYLRRGPPAYAYEQAMPLRHANREYDDDEKSKKRPLLTGALPPLYDKTIVMKRLHIECRHIIEFYYAALGHRFLAILSASSRFRELVMPSLRSGQHKLRQKMTRHAFHRRFQPRAAGLYAAPKRSPILAAAMTPSTLRRHTADFASFKDTLLHFLMPAGVKMRDMRAGYFIVTLPAMSAARAHAPPPRRTTTSVGMIRRFSPPSAAPTLLMSIDVAHRASASAEGEYVTVTRYCRRCRCRRGHMPLPLINTAARKTPSASFAAPHSGLPLRFHILSRRLRRPI